MSSKNETSRRERNLKNELHSMTSSMLLLLSNDLDDELSDVISVDESDPFVARIRSHKFFQTLRMSIELNTKNMNLRKVERLQLFQFSLGDITQNA